MGFRFSSPSLLYRFPTSKLPSKWMNSLRSKVPQEPGTSAGWSDSRALSSRYGWGQVVEEREALWASVASGRGLQNPSNPRQSGGEETTLHGDIWVLARAPFHSLSAAEPQTVSALVSRLCSSFPRTDSENRENVWSE